MDPDDLEKMPREERPRWTHTVAPFLHARAMIEGYGMVDALRTLAPPGDELAEWHPVFLRCLLIFDGHLAELRHREQAARAAKSREASRAAKAKHKA